MNYKNRATKISAYLTTALKRYDEIKATLPELKRKVAKQDAIVAKLEAEISLFWKEYKGDPSYDVLTDFLEDLDSHECEILSEMQDDLSEAISALEDIENGIDDAYYGAAHASEVMV